MLTQTTRHVAIVVPSLTSAGAERVSETLAREFVQTLRVTLVTMEPRLAPRELGNLPKLPWAERIPAGCQHVHLPSTGSGLTRLAPLVVRFAALTRRRRFDAVYSFLTWTNVLVAAAKLLGGRYLHIGSEHAMAESLRSDGGLASIARTLPLVYRLPDWIVVVSDSARSTLLAAGVLPRPERAVTIRNPVDAGEIRRLARAPLEIAIPWGNGPVLMCVARLHAQKDHVTLLRAMTRLPRSYTLVIVGDGPLRKDLHQIVSSLALTNRVIFTGILSNPYPLMQRADVIVLPSKEEGFGLVAAEAAVLGVPFVGSDVGGLGEVCALLGHRTFSAGNDEALADAIRELTSHGFKQPGTADLVARLFSPPKIAAKYLQLSSSSH